jgi:hypothetical protein
MSRAHVRLGRSGATDEPLQEVADLGAIPVPGTLETSNELTINDQDAGRQCLDAKCVEESAAMIESQVESRVRGACKEVFDCRVVGILTENDDGKLGGRSRRKPSQVIGFNAARRTPGGPKRHEQGPRGWRSHGGGGARYSNVVLRRAFPATGKDKGQQDLGSMF